MKQKGVIMKKLILFSILSVLLYSAPGHAAGRGTGDMDQALGGKAPAAKAVDLESAARSKALEEVAERRAARSAAAEAPAHAQQQPKGKRVRFADLPQDKAAAVAAIEAEEPARLAAAKKFRAEIAVVTERIKEKEQKEQKEERERRSSSCLW